MVMRDSIESARRRRLMTWIGGAVLAASYSGRSMAAVNLSAFRLVRRDTVHLHFDLDRSLGDAKLFTLTDPHRLVIDLPQTTLATALPKDTFSQGVVSGLRYAHKGDGTLRIVVDLRRAIEPGYRFVGRQGGQRLLVDLGVRDDVAPVKARSRRFEGQALRDVVVAIDAGHGGKDPRCHRAGWYPRKGCRAADRTPALSQAFRTGGHFGGDDP